eukprot:Blabericola_migrator_1__219@NODE_1058_length_5569_cov_7_008179_g728_i0_p2_GENE_NODE_1058_length_5569_cov_7_008179_g728_i0NODE_1058_length_5569_cov_7_008179_g728_i0_p2_ORF_typecomplete_len455_score80_19_NODE_1058_length_5569_cov_7_008179_g728_i017083072
MLTSLGPSKWSIVTQKRTARDVVGVISQATSIVGIKDSGLGTMLLLKRHLYTSAFAVFRIRLTSGDMYGSVGLVFGFIDDRNYMWLELARSASSPKSLSMKFREMHLGKIKDWGSEISCSKITSDPDIWIMVGVKFGESTIASIDGGKCAVNVKLDETLRAGDSRNGGSLDRILLGSIGLFTNGLALKTSAEFSDLVIGPLSAEVEYGKIAFGDEIKKDIQLETEAHSVRVQNGTEVSAPTQSVTIQTVATANTTASIPTNSTETVLSEDGTCYSSYTQDLLTAKVHDTWALPSSQEAAAWLIDSGQMFGTMSGSNSVPIYLRLPMCADKSTIRIETSIKMSEGGIGGIMWRRKSPNDFYSFVLNGTNYVHHNLIQTTVITVGGVAEVIASNALSLTTDWVNITMIDSGTKIRIYTNSRLSQELSARPVLTKLNVGLILMKSGMSLRSYNAVTF